MLAKDYNPTIKEYTITVSFLASLDSENKKLVEDKIDELLNSDMFHIKWSSDGCLYKRLFCWPAGISTYKLGEPQYTSVTYNMMDKKLR